MKHLLCLLLLLCSTLASFGQHISDTSPEPPGKTICGRVLDENGEPSGGATVKAVSDTTEDRINFKTGAITDADGRFTLTIPGKYVAAARYILISNLNSEPEFFAIPANSDSVNASIKEDKAHRPDEDVLILKPAIYLYPPQPSVITIQHTFKGTIGTTYPEYGDGWTVRAQPGGQLLNLKDNRTYEYLFWDGVSHFGPEHYIIKEGFVVQKKGTAAFLREKLELVGLNPKEVNDFIVYWLPVLDQSSCNLIRFRINDDIDHTSVLTVTPEPDSRIRLFMEFQPVDADLKVPEQQLHRYPRKGFTLVEWGGARLGEPLVLQ